MKGSRKGAIPVEMQTWLDRASEDWTPSYPFNDPQVRAAVRGALVAEQRGLCVYCGRQLSLSEPGKTYHVEHFRPRALYPELALDYSNLFLSCGQKDDNGRPSPTCGNVKENWFDESFHVTPDYPSCASRFKFTLNGNAVAAANDLGALNMIQCLQLNYAELVKDRADILAMLDGGVLDEHDFFDFGSGIGESLAHVAYQHVGKLMP